MIINNNMKFSKVIYIYILFLFLLTNDFFELTSFITFQKQNFMYYDLYQFFISWLFIPVIVYAIYCLCVKNSYEMNSLFVFLWIVLMKDLILFYIYDSSYLLQYTSFELYWQFFISFCIIITVFSIKKKTVDLMCFFEIFIFLNMFTLIISVFTGIGTGLYGFEKRYHAANLTHGETGFIMAVSVIYFLCYKKEKYSNLFGLISLLMVFATGSRKDILYILIIYAIYLANQFFYRRRKKIKFSMNQIIVYYLIGIFILIVSILFGEIIIKKLDIERILELLAGILDNGLAFMTSDYSGKGRIDSLNAAFQLIKSHPVGVSFSFFDVQYNMQLNNYPTFPHSTLIFYYCVLGPLIVIPIYLYIKNFIMLFKLKNNFVYIYSYFFIYNTISGGALLNFKSLVINIFILWIGTHMIKEMEI